MAGIPHPAGREDLEAKVLVRDDREEDDEHQAKPEVRQGDPDERAGGDQVVELGVLLDGGDDPDRNRERERHDVEAPHQDQGLSGRTCVIVNRMREMTNRTGMACSTRRRMYLLTSALPCRV